MIEAPEVLETLRQKIAFIHIEVSRDEIRSVMGPGLEELRTALEDQGIAPCGPWFTHHFSRPAETFDFAICMPVGVAVRLAGRVRDGELAAARVARAVYRGPYGGLAEAWGELREWVAANGHVAASDLWEVYVADQVTELNQPLVR